MTQVNTLLHFLCILGRLKERLFCCEHAFSILESPYDFVHIFHFLIEISLMIGEISFCASENGSLSIADEGSEMPLC